MTRILSFFYSRLKYDKILVLFLFCLLFLLVIYLALILSCYQFSRKRTTELSTYDFNFPTKLFFFVSYFLQAKFVHLFFPLLLFFFLFPFMGHFLYFRFFEYFYLNFFPLRLGIICLSFHTFLIRFQETI